MPSGQDYYLLINNVPHGPYTAEQIQDWIKSQSSQADLNSVSFAIAGSSNWQPVSSFSVPSVPAVAPPPPVPDKKAPPTKASEQKSGCFGGVLKLFAIFVILMILGGLLPKSTDQKETPKEPSPKEQIQKQLNVSMNWGKDGFGTVMVADLFFTNDSPHTVKDPEIAVITYGSSGTRISRKKYVITQTIPPLSKITVPKFNFGFVNSQVQTASVNIVDFSFILAPKSNP
jgi:hypothetical protein